MSIMPVDLAAHIRNVPDFPIPGVQFKDITSLLLSPEAFNEAIDRMVTLAGQTNIDCLAAVDFPRVHFRRSHGDAHGVAAGAAAQGGQASR